MAILFTLPNQVRIGASGAPYAGATVTFYAQGTLTLQSVYQDAACTNAHQNPVTADAAGQIPKVFLNPNADADYRIIIKSSAGVTLDDEDDIPRSPYTQAQIGQLANPRTQSEIDGGVIPASYTGAADPERDTTRRDQFLTSNSAADNKTAIQTAHTAANGRPIVISAGTYSMQEGVDTSGNIYVQGSGKGENGPPLTELSFNFSSGSTIVAWDFTGGTTRPVMKDLFLYNIAGPGGIPDSAIYGIGIKGNSMPYPEIENLWISGFNTGFFFNGQCFYGRITNLVCTDNYSAGMEFTGSLVNGATILGGQASRTVHGPGVYMHDIGSHATFVGQWRESNKGTSSVGGGIHASGFHVLTDIGSYHEDNDFVDKYFPNIYPYGTATHVAIGCYHDADQEDGQPRIRGTMTRYVLIGNKFHNGHLTSPVPVLKCDDVRGYQGSVFIGNEYALPNFTNVTNENAFATFLDSKHPRVFFSDSTAASGANAHPGTTWINNDSSVPAVLAWKTLSPGWIGSPPAIAITASTTNASKVVMLSAAAQPSIFTGLYIQIAGVTFGGAAYTMVCEVRSDGTAIIETAAQQTVAGAALSYKQGTLQIIPMEVESSTAPATATSGTIATANLTVSRVSPAGAITGVILQSGTYTGQRCTVINESANSITMAASGTSHVADGVSDVIAALTARDFKWNTVTSLWYRCG